MAELHNFVAELYTLGEDGQPNIEDRLSIENADLEAAKRQANEWTMTVSGVLYRAKHVRLIKDFVAVWERPLGEFF